MYDEQESREHELAPELDSLERQFRGITPAAPRIDRDRMMFAAGRATASAEPGQDGRAMYDRAGCPLHIAGPSWAGRRFWPAATFTMTAAALLLATMLVWQNRSQSVARLTIDPQSTTAIVAAPRTTEGKQVDRIATRALWSTIPSASSGYLGIRYIALTRGMDDFSFGSQLSGEGDETPSNPSTKPGSARGLLNELLPPDARTPRSSS